MPEHAPEQMPEHMKVSQRRCSSQGRVGPVARRLIEHILRSDQDYTRYLAEKGDVRVQQRHWWDRLLGR
jgi:hypothetical protein